jgi:GAF domain-containing protein
VARDEGTDDGSSGLRVASGEADPASTQEGFIVETLAWCAEVFQARRVRFLRPRDAHGWTVYTRYGDSLSTHEADYAEAAMARTVGLGRQPLVVTRPRVSRPGTDNLRPISVSSYLGIPLICQDQLAGVIECAGGETSAVEAALRSALPHLDLAGQRLLFDPALRGVPEVTAGTQCVLGGGVRLGGTVTLSADELAFVSAIDGATTVAVAAAAASLTVDAARAMATSLIARGLLEVAGP